MPAATPFPDASAYAAAAGGHQATLDAPYPGTAWAYPPAPGYQVPMYQQHEATPTAAFGEPGTEQPLPYVPPTASSAQQSAEAVWPGAPQEAPTSSADSTGEQPTVDGMHLLPAWYPDPSGRHEFRWWDGQGWAEFVLDQDQSSVDPL
jgi:hypothetical protein